MTCERENGWRWYRIDGATGVGLRLRVRECVGEEKSVNLCLVRDRQRVSVQAAPFGRASSILGVLLLALLLAIAGCQGEGAERETPDRQTGEKEADSVRGTVIDGELREGELFTFGFTPDGHPFKGDPSAAVIIEEF